MQNPPLPSRADFQNALTDVQLKVVQIVQATFLAGIAVFTLAVLFVFSASQAVIPVDETFDVVRTLTIVDLIFLLGSIIAARIIPGRIFSPAALAAAAIREDAHALALKCVNIQRSALVVRLALLEGSAFFGLTVCLSGASNGVLMLAPLYWINLLPAFCLLGFGLASFPTRDRLLEWFERSFHRPD